MRFKVKKQNITFYILYIIVAPLCSAFLKRVDFYKAHRSQKRGVLRLASYPVHCAMSRRDNTKTIKDIINEAFVASSGDILTFMHLADAFIQMHYSGYTFIVSMCVLWELNTQPFVPLTQCSTTEPQEHRNNSFLIIMTYTVFLHVALHRAA